MFFVAVTNWLKNVFTSRKNFDLQNSLLKLRHGKYSRTKNLQILIILEFLGSILEQDADKNINVRLASIIKKQNAYEA